jgi:hypothetical protein
MTRLHMHLVVAILASIFASCLAEPVEFDENELEVRDEVVIAKGVYVCSQPNWTGSESAIGNEEI